MRYARWTFVMLVVVSSAAGATGQDWDRARRYYEEAIAESGPGRRLELFERSFNEHATYEAAIGLAEAGLELDLPSARSLEWLDKAFRLAKPGEARARVLFRIGEIHLGEGDQYLARDYMVRSLEHLRGAPDPSQNVEAGIRRVERALQEVWGDEPPVVPTADIIDALRRREPGDPRGAVPEIDLWINFEFDSARLTRTGRDQADELGEALLDLAADEGGRTLSFVLVGHTDTRGSRDYNDRLSLRRARAVRDYLYDEFRLVRGNFAIDVEGRGEREPVSSLETDAAHALNRRVEVILLW